MSAAYAVNGRFLTQTLTGVQRYAHNIVGAMSDMGSPELTVIAPESAPDDSGCGASVTRSGRLRGHAWEQLQLPRFWQGPLLNLCNTAPAAKAEQIVCIHDANVFAAPDSYSRGFRTAYRALLPHLARRCRIVTVSQSSARQLARYLPIAAEDIAVLPNGHEHALRWDPGRSTVARAFLADRTRGRPFVLALGSRARHKNLALLMEIAPGLDELGIDLVVAGGGGQIFAAETLASAANVFPLGRVEDDDLALLFEQALCLAFPSRTEGFGLPIVEAMAWGCPVLSSNTASMPEVCGNAALLAPPDEPRRWLEEIARLAASPVLRSELAGRGRERVSAFSWRASAEGYADLMAAPSPRRRSAAQPSPAARPRIAAIVATRGRPDIVTATVRDLLDRQSTKPDIVIVSCSDTADAGALASCAEVRLVIGPPGLPTQRNAALAALPHDIDIVAFFDDDFVAHRDWLAVAAQTFRDEDDVIGFTGRLLADGAGGPGITFSEAQALVATPPASPWTWIEPYSPYGCNMAFRRATIGEQRFDERLVLYGWLEDRDFAAALAKRGGRLVKCADAIGVHMGVKVGRVAGERFGYSQIVNPLYMLRKGTMTLGQVADHLFRNVVSNLGRSIRPEPFIDRRGRLRGNAMGVLDLLRGRLQPERAAIISTGSRLP